MNRIDPKKIINGVRNLASNEVKRLLPTSKGGEQATLINYQTAVYSYFTTPNLEAETLYFAENWVRAKLTLETAGPVAIGTVSQIGPVLSGKGRLLDTGVEYEIYLARGTSLYILSEAVNRVSVTIEPIPWMEQISGEITSVAQTISHTVRAVGNAIIAALGGQQVSTPTAPQPTPMNQMPTPKLPARLAPRLTRITPPKKIGR